MVVGLIVFILESATGALATDSANRAPVVLARIGPLTLNEGGEAARFNLKDFISDPDGDPLGYGGPIPAFVDLGFDGEVMTVIPRKKGRETVTMRATDPSGLYADLPFSVTVVPGNRAPVVLRLIDDLMLTVGGLSGTVDLSSRFRDPEGESLSFTATSGNPEGVAVAIRKDRLTVSATAAGTTTVTVVAKDPAGARSLPLGFRVAATPPVPVEIPDANLRAGLEGEMGKDSGSPINSAEMETLEALNCESCGVSDLTGLEFAASLTELHLDDNAVTKLAPLSGLARLVYLDLSNNPVRNLAPLEGLPSLRELRLSENEMTDVSSLAGLVQLTRLGLSRNRISDVSPLSGLKALMALWLWNNKITDIRPLSGLANLQVLALRDNSVDDLQPLSELGDLEWLGLDGNLLTDIRPLAGLTDLRWLNLNDNSLTDVSSLSTLKNLEWLNLGRNSVVDVAALSGLKKLQTLILDRNSVADVQPLSGLPDLEELSAPYNSLAGKATLSGLPSLWRLNLDGNSLVSLAFTGLGELSSLSLGDNDLAELNGLSGLTDLRSLSAAGNAVTDLSPLSGLTEVTVLDLSRNAISDVTPLAKLAALRSLKLSYNSIEDVAPLAGLANIERLELGNNCLTSILSLRNSEGLGEGDFLSLEWNALHGSAVARDVKMLRDRGATVRISESPTVEVKAPRRLRALPVDGGLDLTWTPPPDPVYVTTYELRWRSPTGAFTGWSTVPCSGKLRHRLSDLVNGVTYTVELRALGHDDNGIARADGTPRASGGGTP